MATSLCATMTGAKGPFVLVKNLKASKVQRAPESSIYEMVGPNRRVPYNHKLFSAEKTYVMKCHDELVKVTVLDRADSVEELMSRLKQKQDAMNKTKISTRVIKVPKRRSSGPLSIPLDQVMLQEEKEKANSNKVPPQRQKATADLQARLAAKVKAAKRQQDSGVFAEGEKKSKTSQATTEPPSNLPDLKASGVAATDVTQSVRDQDPASGAGTITDSGVVLSDAMELCKENPPLDEDHFKAGVGMSTPIKKSFVSLAKAFPTDVKDIPKSHGGCHDNTEQPPPQPSTETKVACPKCVHYKKKYSLQSEMMAKEVDKLRLEVDSLKEDKRQMMELNQRLTTSLQAMTDNIAKKMEDVQAAAGARNLKTCKISKLQFLGGSELPPGVTVPDEKVYIIDQQRMIEKKLLVEVEKANTFRQRVLKASLLYFGTDFKKYVCPGASEDKMAQVPDVRLLEDSHIETILEILNALSWKRGALPTCTVSYETVKRMMGKVASALRNEAPQGKKKVATEKGGNTAVRQDNSHDFSQVEVSEILDVTASFLLELEETK